jgi:hypothetical protein
MEISEFTNCDLRFTIEEPSEAVTSSHRLTPRFAFLVALLFSFGACQPTGKPLSKREMANDFHAANNKLTEVIIYDIFTPPVAARIYAYSNLAAYEAMRGDDPKMASMAGKINGFSAVPPPSEAICRPLAGIAAFLAVARNLTFSTQYFDELEANFLDKYRASVAPDVFVRSLKFGEITAANVLNFASSDQYKPTRGLRYTLKKTPGSWQPTPPNYADAVEPNWGKMRPFALDSAGQFKISPPFGYNLAKKSPFWQELAAVYSISKKLTEDEKRVAWFWDDNAFVAEAQGHAMLASKKMTPGGHWLAIAQKQCLAHDFSAAESAQVSFLVSAALFDGFIGCWKIKYETHRVRPETVINEHLDKDWQPFLQTPPFPEFPSGHSTISAASAEVLTAFFGENVAFTDSTEYVFGHGVGHFSSFRAAADEASRSRVLGGIHYKSGCEQGLILGEKIGKQVLEKLK